MTSRLFGCTCSSNMDEAHGWILWLGFCGRMMEIIVSDVHVRTSYPTSLHGVFVQYWVGRGVRTLIWLPGDKIILERRWRPNQFRLRSPRPLLPLPLILLGRTKSAAADITYEVGMIRHHLRALLLLRSSFLIQPARFAGELQIHDTFPVV